MSSEQAKGYMFEEIIASLLRRSGYSWDEHLEERDQLQGRGARHQIDTFGLANYSHPFISKIRLLAECKYKTKETVGIEVVRNMVGVLQDITQNYFSENHEIADQILFKRYTDTGVIFSNTSFAKLAVSYGFAHNVFLVSYKGNPIMSQIISSFEDLCKYINFRRVKTKLQAREIIKEILRGNIGHLNLNFRRYLNNLFDESLVNGSITAFNNSLNNASSLLAFIDGSYPVHIFSEVRGSLLQQILSSDRNRNGTVGVGYMYEWREGSDIVSFKFKVHPNRNIFYFTLPAYIFREEKLRSRNLIDLKERFLNNIIIPIPNEQGLVQIALKFDRELIREDWIESS